MDGIKALFSDAHGVLAFLIIISATVLTAMKIMTVEQWTSLAEVVFGAFAVAHVGSAVSSAIKARGAAQPAQKVAS